MVRVIKHKNKEYLTVDTSLEVIDQGKTTTVPVYVQIDVTSVPSNELVIIYKTVSKLFNHVITANLIKPVKSKKSWWKKLFSKHDLKS